MWNGEPFISLHPHLYSCSHCKRIVPAPSTSLGQPREETGGPYLAMARLPEPRDLATVLQRPCQGPFCSTATLLGLQQGSLQRRMHPTLAPTNQLIDWGGGFCKAGTPQGFLTACLGGVSYQGVGALIPSHCLPWREGGREEGRAEDSGILGVLNT